MYKPTGKRFSRSHIIENVEKIIEIIPQLKLENDNINIILYSEHDFFLTNAVPHLRDCGIYFNQKNNKIIINYEHNLKMSV